MGGSSSKEFVETKLMCKAAIRGSATVKDREDKVLDCFKKWDSDNSGSISREELADLLTNLDAGFTHGGVDHLMKAADRDKDGVISFEEMTGLLFRAPHLEKYMDQTRTMLEKHQKELADATLKISKANADPFGAMGEIFLKIKELTRKQQVEIESELGPLLQKSFDWHDKDGSGLLEIDESILMFCNYAGMMPLFCKDVSKMTLIQNMKNTKAQMSAQMGSAAAKEFGKTMEVAIEQQMNQLDAEVEARRRDYLANQDKYHRAAFELLDVNKDQRLQGNEVVQAFMHGTPRNKEFVEALGLSVEPAALQSADLDGGCSQQ